MADQHHRNLLLRKKVLLLSLLVKRLKPNTKRQYKTKRWWVHPIWQNRKTQGDFGSLLEAMRAHDHSYFQNYTRMSPDKFDFLLRLMNGKLQKECFGRLDIISPGEMLAVTLRFLASGNSLASMAYSFRMSKTSVHNVIKKVCQLLWDTLQPIYLEVPTTETWRKAAIEYEERWNFPLCCGAVDGKHIMMQQPPNSGSLYHNYKGFNSIVLMAVVNANYTFLTVDIGAYGSTSDGGVFKASCFGKSLQEGKVGLPGLMTLPGSNIEVPHVLVGDEAFQLLPTFMRPYSRDSLNDKKRIFNYRLSRARRCSENAFGISAARWRILRTCINMAPENVDLIVKAIVVLHNFLLTEESKQGNKLYCSNNYADHFDEKGNLVEGEWHSDILNHPANALENIAPTAARNYNWKAGEIRDKFAEYFSTDAGEVPWQYEITPGLSNNC